MTVLPRTGGRARTAIRLLPGYARHLMLRPYRAQLPSTPIGRAWETAAYDLFLNLLLSGFIEISGQSIRRGTAQLLILLNRIAFLMDDEFERRVRKESVAFEDLLTTNAIGNAVTEMRTYLDATCDPARCNAIKLLLRRTVETEYLRYATLIEGRRTISSIDDLLDDAAVDSGAVLRQLAQVIGLFNGSTAPQAALDDFAALGLACKFADDLRDWQHDSETGAGNILLAILVRYPSERQRLARAQGARLRMNEHRWRRLCPKAFSEFADMYGAYYARIQTSTLRVAADLMMETGRSGHLPNHDGRTAARV